MEIRYASIPRWINQLTTRVPASLGRRAVCHLSMTGLRQIPINRWLLEVTAG
jgi:hypothetical protein